MTILSSNETLAGFVQATGLLVLVAKTALAGHPHPSSSLWSLLLQS